MNRQAEGFEGTEAKIQVAENSNSNLDSVRASTFGPPDRTPSGQNKDINALLSKEEVRARFQKSIEQAIVDETSVGPVKRGQGYFQALKDRYPEMKDEDASKEAKRIKKLSDSRDVLKVGEMLPTMSPEKRKEMLDQIMKGYDAATNAAEAHIKRAEAERAAEKAEQERVAAEKLEQERAATEKVEQEKAAAEKVEQERAATEKAEQERAATEKAEQERAAAERAEQERAATAKAEQERKATEKDSDDEKPATTPDFGKLNTNPQRAVPSLPENLPSEQGTAPKKEEAQKNAVDEKPCEGTSELGRNLLGGVITGGAIGAAVGEGVGAIPGALVGAAWAYKVWRDERNQCILEKQSAAEVEKK